MKLTVWILVVLLIVLHQWNLFGGDATLVFGFMPVALMYHVGISLAAAATWYLAVRFAWPDDLVEQTIEAVECDERGGDA